MFSFDEVKSLLCKKFEEFTIRDKAILTDVFFDSKAGRYSKFLMWDTERRNAFFKYLKHLEINYFELNDVERWTVEDAFDM